MIFVFAILKNRKAINMKQIALILVALILIFTVFVGSGWADEYINTDATLSSDSVTLSLVHDVEDLRFTIQFNNVDPQEAIQITKEISRHIGKQKGVCIFKVEYKNFD